MREMIDPIRHEHVSVLSWHQQREEFRKNAHRELRLREGLPEVENARYLMPDGKRYGVATGAMKGAGAGLLMYDAVVEAAITAEEGFTVKCEGTKEFDQEISDLLRDSLAYERSLIVRHDLSEDDLIARTYCPEMPDTVVGNEDAIIAWMQKHLEEDVK